ncbi:MAG: WD40/YVTN/BNR-like repeat-containing protein, partial [Halohasta sp.]
PERLFVGTAEAGVLRSVDGGETFERVGSDDIGPELITAVAIGTRSADEIWVGTEPSRVYRSTDAGETWTEMEGLTDLPSASEWSFPPRPHTHHVRWIEPDPYDRDHLYVSIEAGALVQSHDAGETWEDRRPTARRDVHSMTTHPEVPGYAWVAAGDGYAETRDGGSTWAKPQEGLDHRYCWGVAVDADDPACVLVSAAHGSRSAHTPEAADSYVYRRRDGGRWQRLDDRGLPMGEGVVRAALARGHAPGEFYAATNRGLYRTANQGSSWTAIDVPWDDSLRSQTPQDIAVVAE